MSSAPAPTGQARRRAAQPGLPSGYTPLPGYIGRSFLQLPGVRGDWRGADYRGWIRIDAHYWDVENVERLNREAMVVRAPNAPRSGAGTLVLSVRKDSPALAALMQLCRDGASITEATYAVSADGYNQRGLRMQRLANVPANFEFRLTDVSLADCPVVDDAPEQAFVVRFNDIRWLNWSNEANSVPVALEPARLAPLPAHLSGESRAWVLTWLGLAHDVSADQCPVVNVKPGEADYYALVPPAEAEAERAALASEGGVSFEDGRMGRRGPHRLNAVALPGIIADPGQAEPQTTVARGFDLDGNNSRAGGRRDYVSADGRISGIDNQLYTALGCNIGWQGHRGFFYQYAMEQLRNGQFSVMLQIDGIDNERNDNEVYVTMLYSRDSVAKNAAGTQILSDYTFRLNENPFYSHYAQRVRGRIVDGVVITEPVDEFRVNLGRWAGPLSPGGAVADARMRIELRPDRTIRGVLGGYVDWRELITIMAVTFSEFNYGYQTPALYNSLRRNADGMRDRTTGEFNGISAAWDIEGVPAFVAPPNANVAGANPAAGGGS